MSNEPAGRPERMAGLVRHVFSGLHFKGFAQWKAEALLALWEVSGGCIAQE
jgi:hypothetical protein